jgi:hypothetical protein
MALPAIGDGEQIGDGNTNETLSVGRSGQPVKVQPSSTGTLSFYGATAVAQRTGASQAAVSTSTIPAVSATVVNASASGGSATWGFASSTQAVNIVDTVNDLKTRVSAIITLENEMRASLVGLGVIAGA